MRERLAAIGERYFNEVTEYERQRVALDESHKETVEALAHERDTLEQLLALEEQRAGTPALTKAQRIATHSSLSE